MSLVKRCAMLGMFICLFSACSTSTPYTAKPLLENCITSTSYWEKETPKSVPPADSTEGMQPKNQPVTEWPTLEESMAAYEQFLSGRISAKSDRGESNLINEFLGYEKGETYRGERYGYFDMNGDAIPELHLRGNQGYGYRIFTYIDGQVTQWYSGAIYSYPLANRAIGYMRNGAAPTHITYQYEVLDYWGETELKVTFEHGDGSELETYKGQYDYNFEGEWVSKETWGKLTAPYLSAEKADISWNLMQDYCS